MALARYLIASVLLASSTWAYAIGEGRARNESRVNYHLYTRENPILAQVIELDDLEALQNSNFDPRRPTKFFAHGWNSGPHSADSTRREYLAREDCNFFSIDWSWLSAGVDYPIIILVNAPLAAEHTAEFIDFVVNNTGASLSTFHLIGFSAGSHVVGGAGAHITTGRIPRITGLDPAKPFLSVNRTDNRLDTSDADFVDVIHTNSGDLLSNELSFLEPIGHVDFYPNGGQFQPGCTNLDVQSKGGCDHGRAVSYFAESINSPVGFRAVLCASESDFVNGLCANNAAVLMGEPTPSTSRGIYYLATNSSSPYALG